MIIINLSKIQQSIYQNSINLTTHAVEKSLSEKDEIKYEIAYISDEVFDYLKTKFKSFREQHKKLYIRIENDLYHLSLLDTKGATFEEAHNVKKITIRESIVLMKVNDYEDGVAYEEIKGKYLN